MQFGDLFSYTCVENKQNSIRYKLSINANHEVFKGHFPGLPILPGVMQVEAIKEIFCLATGKKLQLKTAKDIKFLAMLNPLDVKQVECIIEYTEQEGNEYKANASLAGKDSNFLKLRGVFSEG